MTALIDRLERDGHARRAPWDTDRRKLRLFLSTTIRQQALSFYGQLGRGIVEAIDLIAQCFVDAAERARQEPSDEGSAGPRN